MSIDWKKYSAGKAYDELIAADGAPRPVAAAVCRYLEDLTDGELEARQALGRMLDLWPAAAQNMNAILDFWFPFEDLAEIFSEGLIKAGFSMGN